MKLNNLLMFICFLTLPLILNAQGQKFHLLVANSEGIHVYDFNSQTGQVSFKTKTTGNSAGFLTVAADRKHVYSSTSGAAIAAYGFNPASGELTFLNKQPTGGGGAAYVSVDASKKYVFSASYGGGTISALSVLPDGSLGTNVQVITHEGSSIHKVRQTKPYVHSAVVSPDNRYVLAQDLGTDKINVYSFNPSKPAPLTPTQQAFVSVTPGSGPRHLTFHPNKKFVYLIHEMGSLISGYKFAKGVLKPIEPAHYIQKGPIIPPDDGHAADIHVSPDGKFLYGSERGDNHEIVIYSINKKTGKLTFAGRQSTLGKRPTNFKIDPTGNFLLVGNTDTSDLFVFKRDKSTGLLTPTGTKVEINRPSCLVLVPVN